jgi:hypothetical protein
LAEEAHERESSMNNPTTLTINSDNNAKMTLGTTRFKSRGLR